MRPDLRHLILAVSLLVTAALRPTPVAAQGGQPDWSRLEAETMEHFQAILRLDTSNPPGNEGLVVDYLDGVLKQAGIETKRFANDLARPNLVARLKGNGRKRPLLIMGHTDVVKVDPAKWTHPPFSATRDGGYVYGRGTVDDKDNVVAALMVMLQLKRLNVPLDRDVIFLAEAGEEASTQVGIKFMVDEHWPEIDAEYCFAEGGGVTRTGGQVRFASVQSSEKIPYGVTLTARGPAGHGSVPLRTNAVVHLSKAIARIGDWQAPMRLNETTKTYFERLATISGPEEAARYRNLTNPAQSAAIQEHFAVNEPRHNSMLRTSVSPNMVAGGYQVNVIPSEATATLDVRALPDEDMDRLVEALRTVVDDPAVEVARNLRNTRPGAPPSRIDSEAFTAVEAAVKAHYGAGVTTLPTMSTGATDMAFLRAKGVQCYGVGPLTDSEDGPKGFGAHSDQERILESSLHTFVRFHWDIVVKVAGAR
jgi:acetylornithine deacetylase/succinyl-diaminopimelate desuccinylase-like protein